MSDSWQVYIRFLTIVNIYKVITHDIIYQLAFWTPTSSPRLAFRRNWNYKNPYIFVGQYIKQHEYVLTLHRPNSLMMPLPLPDSVHLFLTVAGRVSLGKVFSCSWAWWRICGDKVWLRATYRYALRITSVAWTVVRLFISRSTRVFMCMVGGEVSM